MDPGFQHHRDSRNYYYFTILRMAKLKIIHSGVELRCPHCQQKDRFGIVLLAEFPFSNSVSPEVVTIERMVCLGEDCGMLFIPPQLYRKAMWQQEKREQSRYGSGGGSIAALYGPGGALSTSTSR